MSPPRAAARAERAPQRCPRRAAPGALNSRVVIEQVTGRLAERLGLEMGMAFPLLREYPRNSNQRLAAVARKFVTSASADFSPPPRRTAAQPSPTRRRT